MTEAVANPQQITQIDKLKALLSHKISHDHALEKGVRSDGSFRDHLPEWKKVGIPIANEKDLEQHMLKTLNDPGNKIWYYKDNGIPQILVVNENTKTCIIFNPETSYLGTTFPLDKPTSAKIDEFNKKAFRATGGKINFKTGTFDEVMGKGSPNFLKDAFTHARTIAAPSSNAMNTPYPPPNMTF